MVSRLPNEPVFFPSQVFLNDLCARVSKQQFDTWFKGTPFEFIPPNRIVISSPTRFHRQWLEAKFKDPIRHAVRAIFHFDPDLDFRLAAAILPETVPIDPSISSAAATGKGEGCQQHPARHPGKTTGPGKPDSQTLKPTAASAQHGSAIQSSTVKKEHSFQNFAVGPSNRFAFTALYAITESRLITYNPILVHGNTGLGKTHLLQACYLKLLENQERTAIYWTGSDFIDSLYKFSGAQRRELFHSMLKKKDVLIFDDLPQLAKSPHFQDEFLRIFNDAIACGHQLILSSDKSLKELALFKDKLISRLKMGLITRLEPLHFETRLDLIHKKAAILNLRIPEPLAQSIAGDLNLSPREIEGRLLQSANLIQSSPEPDLLNHLLGGSLPGSLSGKTGFSGPVSGGSSIPDRHTARNLNITDILRIVAAYYNLKRADLLSGCREKSLVLARQVAMFLSRKLTSLSLEEIGTFYGGRDHATVIHSINKITELVDKDTGIREDLGILADQLNACR